MGYGPFPFTLLPQEPVLFPPVKLNPADKVMDHAKPENRYFHFLIFVHVLPSFGVFSSHAGNTDTVQCQDHRLNPENLIPTSLITNIISGIVLTYSRGLKIGDRVKIGETIGDVVDRTLLITRVRTIKNVVITIPNVLVMQNEIINFSSEARDAGLILHTSVTIGYDEPWRNVQKLFVTAARETVDIMEYPEPYVLKTSLDNHYITYELNAYTDRPLLMEDIYSELHQNILDKFNQAEVEILSPTYLAFRDGQSTTINQVEITGNGSKPSKENHTTSYRSYREKTQPLGSR